VKKTRRTTGRFIPMQMTGLKRAPLLFTAYLVGWYSAATGKFLGEMRIYSEPTPTAHLSRRPRVLAKMNSQRSYEDAVRKLKTRMLQMMRRRGS